jgi:uncharacterized RDD family membrane protein YckC
MTIQSVPEVRPEDSQTLDPSIDPERYRKVRRKRIMALLVDLVAVTILYLGTLGPMLVLGLLTGGLAFALVPALWLLVVIAYAWFTLAKTGQTPGMKLTDLRLVLANGDKPDTLIAVSHPVLFGLSVTALTPFVLLVGLFNEKKRLLHDFLLGTVVIHDPPRARNDARIS